ncbi:hypothetical protein [Mycobacterium sherrisii]|uniref:Transmembrane protein n=1 Tax=Mycobacterium sherrisii TaxID=243061 RepID=A0A1E3T0V9_9MYCO|nr:hypothetical protein [Mycobacterium sherrisii]MCV7028127.1 hypothetical protein [Mycobacterium sherrisii]MEC4762712.1 hypothetical protein [Mycobacterium sherrisii]ODR07463.1 hypothetical protein BHQ21_08745 [Mycobacterium sherrisii]ORW78752.1 hypothetical protein AWC25_05760 [Mycobacterium sherrisii]
MTAPQRRAASWALPAYALLLSLLVTGPLLRPGYLLLRDAVSTPRSYLSDTALGLTAPPRATPQDFAVALASQLIDGGVVVKALLVLGLWLAGWGAARLVATALPGAGLSGQFVAATLAIWNPYVAERLLQGHWSLLVGYGCLPWVATAVLRLRSQSTGWFALAFWIALAGLTPTGLMLAATVGLVCAVGPGVGRRWLCVAAVLGAALAAALPWLVAASDASLAAPDAAVGVVAFAPRAEPGLGTLGSLAGLGGIWNSEAVPSSRATLFAAVSTLVLLSVVAAGLPTVLRHRTVVPLLGLATAAVLLPAALATGPGLHLLASVVDAVPGLGVLRDGQKWVALAMPGYALAGAGAVVTVRRWLSAPADIAAALTACLALIAVLPDAAWGVGGKVAAVHYPPGWAAVAARINTAPAPVAVLPAGSMRRFAWSGPFPVLDPLPRWVRAEVLSTGDLAISGRVVPGEGHRARAIQELLLSGVDASALVPAGVGWLVVEADTAGDLGAAAHTLSTLTPVYRDEHITLYRVGGPAAGVAPARRQTVVIAHLVWLVLLIGGAGGALVAAVRRRRHGAPKPPTARHLDHGDDTPVDVAED